MAELNRKSLRSWDYHQPAHRPARVAAVGVLANAIGLLLAVALVGSHAIEVIIVAFTYYSNATRIMYEFNQTYRQLESSLTEAAQFTELLLPAPTSDQPGRAPSRCGPKASDVRFEQVTFAHAGGSPLFADLGPRRAERHQAPARARVRRPAGSPPGGSGSGELRCRGAAL